jgi:hypothetical protein
VEAALKVYRDLANKEKIFKSGHILMINFLTVLLVIYDPYPVIESIHGLSRQVIHKKEIAIEVFNAIIFYASFMKLH